MINIGGVTKRFRAITAVDNVSIDITAPQMIGIIGRSGAGKSTLLRLINRLTDPSDGSILVNGRDVLRLKGAAKRAWQRDCAMIFQQFNLVPRLDVITNVLLGRLNRRSTFRSVFKMFSDADIDSALQALERLGISDVALQRAETLSGGQQQRVAIARALMQEPMMLLADEPIASLDPVSAQTVMTALRQIHDRERLTVICNLHTLDTARTYCDRIIGMRAGSIVFDGPAEELSPAAARDIYGAKEELDESVTSTSLVGADPSPSQVASPLAAVH